MDIQTQETFNPNGGLNAVLRALGLQEQDLALETSETFVLTLSDAEESIRSSVARTDYLCLASKPEHQGEAIKVDATLEA